MRLKQNLNVKIFIDSILLGYFVNVIYIDVFMKSFNKIKTLPKYLPNGIISVIPKYKTSKRMIKMLKIWQNLHYPQLIHKLQNLSIP